MIYKGKKHEGQKKTEFTLPAKMIWKSCLYFSWVQLKGVFRPAFFFNLLLWIHVGFYHICCFYLLYSLNSQMWANGSTEKVNVLSPPEKQRQNLLRVSHSGPAPLAPAAWSQAHQSQGLVILGHFTDNMCGPVWVAGSVGLGWVVCGVFLRGRRCCRVFWGVVMVWFGLFHLFLCFFS